MTVPTRIQLSRRRGWRKPPGAVVVARPSRWGNPWRVVRCADGAGWRVVGGGESSASADVPWSKREAAAWAVDRFARSIPAGSIRAHDARIELAGRDLACWCPLVDEHGAPYPCHATVLLHLANSTEEPR